VLEANPARQSLPKAALVNLLNPNTTLLL
jgi:hypothetical protein